jgi:NAD(P)-dependent dehydrogenase (short-subunit alcohol dehydrogenase family)
VELDLKEKRALVTGSSSGIGIGIAEMLAAEGAVVAVHGRDERRTHEVAQRIAEAGGRVEITLGDLADPATCADVVGMVQDALGGVDILVNNAGGGKNSRNNPKWFDVPWEDWPATYEQNVGAAVRLVHAFVPGMVERGWGRVVNLSSAAATTALAEIPDYAAAKAAIANLTVSLSRALAQTNVTVNAITPGMIRTPVMEDWFEAMGEQYGWGETFEEVEKHAVKELFDLPVNFVGRPSDIAATVCLLASSYGRYITGANIRIDGGLARHPN